MNWQLIDAAPKDGTRLWMFCENDDPTMYVGHWESDYWAFSEPLVNDVVGEAYPTHWMPLPEPPK